MEVNPNPNPNPTPTPSPNPKPNPKPKPNPNPNQVGWWREWNSANWMTYAVVDAVLQVPALLVSSHQSSVISH